ncbi:hypothetical protein [Brachyspira pilosicoli]|uniref:hypothetical protein n=1 Tax=Brachyspira pilosicoli TaxID=52584 RepID=UPI00242E81FA|nr:hypothetical protein [Brachyspira pilosicoli]
MNDIIIDCVFDDKKRVQLFIPPFCDTDIDDLQRKMKNYFKNKSKLDQQKLANAIYALLTAKDIKKTKEVRNKKIETTTIIEECFN